MEPRLLGYSVLVATTYALLPAACTPRPTCGNAVVEYGEQCDQGSSNADDAACTSYCARAVCGDGLVGPGEACDDANSVRGDGCEPECSVCGDGIRGGRERCDDSNAEPDDGCDMCLLAGDPIRTMTLGGYPIVVTDRIYLELPVWAEGEWVRVVDTAGATIASMYDDHAPINRMGGRTFDVRADRGVIAAGSTDVDSHGAGLVTHIAWYDADGTRTRLVEIPKPFSELEDNTAIVAVAPDGGAALVGYEYTPALDQTLAVVSRIRPDGSVAWRASFDEGYRFDGDRHIISAAWDTVVAADGLICAAGEGASAWVRCYSQDGALRWRRETDRVLDIGVDGGELVVLTPWEIIRLTLATGTESSRVGIALEPGINDWTARCSDGLVIIAAGFGERPWLALHDATGAQVWHAEQDAWADPDGPYKIDAFQADLGDDGLVYAVDILGRQTLVFDPHL